MTILKHGNTYNEQTCPFCKAEFSFTSIDIHRYECSGEYLSDIYFAWENYITCPECGKRIILETGGI